MDNLSLFGEIEQGTMIESINHSGETVDVVRMEFIEAETLRWQDLFSGFDTLRAITYSSAIGFLLKYLREPTSSVITQEQPGKQIVF